MLRDRLRSHTRVHHERLERGLDIPRSLSSREQYVLLLQRFYGFYVPVEAEIARYRDDLLRCGIDIQGRFKSRKLELDLRSLGMSRESMMLIPLCCDLPNLTTCVRALGCLYVLEGSTLGAQIILRHLEAQLNLSKDFGVSFFAGYGLQTGGMWRSFVECIDAVAMTDADSDAATEGARETFESLERWIVRSPVTTNQSGYHPEFSRTIGNC